VTDCRGAGEISMESKIPEGLKIERDGNVGFLRTVI